MKIAILPTKKRSERLRNKNFKKIKGVPVYIYTIRKIISYSIFDKIIISSDETKIQKDLKKYLPKSSKIIFFHRKKEYCKKNISTHTVIFDVIKKLAINDNDIVTCIYPTSFLINKIDLKNILRMLYKKPNYYIMPVCNYDYNIDRYFTLNRNNVISKLSKTFFKKQQYPLNKIFHDAGQHYSAFVKTWKKQKNLLGKSTIGKIIPSWRSQDIDYLYQWESAIKIYENKR